MNKVSVYSKKAFTLAETIMTLVIISLVVTAAIPVFTAKQLDLTGNDISTPWAYCDFDTSGNICTKETIAGGTCPTVDKKGLCTNNNVVVGRTGADISTPYTYNKGKLALKDEKQANLSIQTKETDANIFDIIKSDNRTFKVGGHTIKEQGNNFIATTENLPSTIGNKNIIIGSAGNTISNYNIVVGKNTSVTNSNNIVLGTGNTVTGGGDIVIGNDNTISSANAIAIGSDMNSVGAGAIAIGSGANTVNANTLNIKNEITANENDITFSENVEVHGSFTTNENPQNISDKRLKNIKGSYNKGLKEILQLEPVNFYYKGNNNLHAGVVAQDIQKIFPEAVVKLPDGYYAVNNDPIFFAMLNALKEINETTQKEEKKQQQLQDELNDLKKEIEMLDGCDAGSFKCKIKYLFYDIKNFFKSIFNREVKYEEV